MSDSAPPVAEGPSTTREERVARLQELLSGARTDSRWARRLRANRSSNILIETALHAAARLSEGLVLSDLEQQLVDQMTQVVTLEEVAEYGKLYKDASGGGEFFPAGVSRLPLERSYALADYVADQEVLVRDVLAQPNVSIIDLGALPEGGQLDSEEFIAAMGEYGSALTLVTGPPLGAQARTPGVFMMKAHKFVSVNDSDEVDSDEIYWASGAGSDEAARREYRSDVFGSLNKGHIRNFADSAVLFQGRVDKFLHLDVECWEEDSGGIFEEISKHLYKISDAALEAAEKGQASGNPDDNAQAAAGALALFGFATKFVGWLFSLFENKDDFVANRSYGFTRAGLVALSKTPAGPDGPAGLAAYDFNGGNEGHFRLWLRTVQEPLDIALVTHRGSWSVPVLPWPGSQTPDAPALALHGGTLYCAVRGNGDQVFVSQRETNGQWGNFIQVPGAVTRHAPALASHLGTLYVAYTGTDGQGNVAHSVQGSDWSAPRTLGGGKCTSGPALAANNGLLWYAATGTDGQLLMVSYLSILGWFPLANLNHPHRSPSAPALVSFRGSVHLAYRGTDNGIRLTTRDTAGWSNPVSLSGTTTGSPALAARGTTLYCAVRGTDDRIYLGNRTGSTWNGFELVPTAGTTGSGPGLAAPGTIDLCLVYRSGDL
ncbi:hypothetical protein OG302_40910 [Streptomyces sp. NBC_01283]|uniref:hypothetical protein n=1 Tax=Streptomyces sp. NBC_01283 TaxID=2903812 RepID=UPI00352BF5C8|nr:hypothetical protein OG302_40910 [Streptomyces sp. NBC_01283]